MKFKFWFSLGTVDAFGLGIETDLLQDDELDLFAIIVGPLYFWWGRHWGYQVRLFGKMIAEGWS